MMLFVAFGFSACSKGDSPQTDINDPSTGKAKAIINGTETYVNWVRLWDGGPKFAEFNMGATAESEFGDCYTYEDTHIFDVTEKIWGTGWRIPDENEMKGLTTNCDWQWTSVNGVKGCRVTGRDNYKTNSIFLPAAGYYVTSWSSHVNQGIYGYYWTSAHLEILRFCDAYSLVLYKSNHTDKLYVRLVLK